MNVESEITPEKAMKILKQGGLEVTINQAGLIVEFLNKLADISLNVAQNQLNGSEWYLNVKSQSNLLLF